MDAKKTAKKSWEKETINAKINESFFLEDKVSSKHHYPKNRIILPVIDQINALRKFFPALNYKKDHFLPPLSTQAEGWLVLPKPRFIASSYNKALEKTLNLLNKERSYFLNCLCGELNTKYLQLTQRTKNFLSHLSAKSHDDLCFLQIQLGSRHIGKSARQAYFDFAENEFGLGPYEITIFLLSHSDWLSSSLDMGIDCIGCEYGPYKHGFFKYVLFFYFHKILKLEERWCGCPDARFGAATSFLIE